MKFFSVNKMRIWALCLAVTSVVSCQKALDINVDPNTAPSATPNLLLPAAQVEMTLPFRTWNYVGSIWGQYWTGGHGVSTDALQYHTMTSLDVENAWTRAYARTLADLDGLVKSGQPVYSGMGKILSAFMYQMLTDFHGAVPFSEAIKGAIEDGSVLAPKYDSEQDIYDDLIPLLNDGIAEVQQSGPGIDQPAADDLMYEGDIDKWVAFANTVKLKVLVRRGNTADALALMNSGALFIEEGEDAMVQFFETSKNTNPLWAQFLARVDVGMYFVASETSIGVLGGLNDPRIDEYYTKPVSPAPASPHLGVVSGNVNDDPFYTNFPSVALSSENRRKFFSSINDQVFSATTPVIFLSSWESKFLQAEVLVREGGAADAMFEAAVQASYNFMGMGSAAGYVAGLGFGAAAEEEKIDILAIQKWISMNGWQMGEGWLEATRFDRPNHRIFTNGGRTPDPDPTTTAPIPFTGGIPSGNVGIWSSPQQNSLGTNGFPTSFVYPTQEISLNPNTPARAVSDRRFWDN